MEKLFRVYMKGDRPTVFEHLGDNRFLCTHGNWVGTAVDVEGHPALKHSYGTAVYDHTKDMSASAIRSEWGEGYV